MRVMLATSVVVIGALIGYAALPGPSAQGQALQAGIAEGEKINIYFDPLGAGRACVVIAVRGDFVGCREETTGIGRAAHERWYNLTLVPRVDRRRD